MKQNIIKIFILAIFLTTTVVAKDTISALGVNQLHFLPKDNKKSEDKILSLIENSKKSIHVAVYNFSHKKFAKALVKSAKKGVNITVLFDKSKIKKDDKIYKYLRSNGINTIIPKGKLHTKMAVFDNKTAFLGSSNWTKESFKKNYEVILFTSDKKVIKEIKDFIENI